jgi:hypothetical protein
MPTELAKAVTRRPAIAGSAPKRVPLVSPANFVMATRDTGYNSTSLAVAEFVDNALQAGASSIDVQVLKTADAVYPIELRVIDNGAGMSAGALASALRFGGSTRFDDRTSLGRYGMGLPNGALSRGRRVEVYTWQGSEVLAARLDVDEIVSMRRHTLPAIAAGPRPDFVPDTRHGTVVWLRRCDRLEYRRASALESRLRKDLGRIYRHFLFEGRSLSVNGKPVPVADPLFLMDAAEASGGRRFGDDLKYELEGPTGPGTVTVTFSELPLEIWHGLSTEQKRELGVTNAPCVSIIRAGREVDRGWFFMGSKRRENYDDWWRCEIRFDPALDELFGITHAKQAIAPSRDLLQTLAPDLEPIARALNSRVRQRFELVKLSSPLGAAEQQAARADGALPRLRARHDGLSAELRRLLVREKSGPRANPGPYRLIVAELRNTVAFDVGLHGEQVVVALNTRHPLFRDLYGPLAASDSEHDQVVAKRIALAVLAAARAELAAGSRAGRGQVRQFRESWTDVLATFFNA